MRSKRAVFLSMLLFWLAQPVQGQPVEGVLSYTLQVASFPNPVLAGQYAERLSQAGESVGFEVAALPGRGQWIRVCVGSFNTVVAARRYGDALISRGLIAEYLVKTAPELQLFDPSNTTSRLCPAKDSRSLQPSTSIRPSASSSSQNVTPAESANGVAVASHIRPASAKLQPVSMTMPPASDRARLPNQPATAGAMPLVTLVTLPLDTQTPLPVADKLQLQLMPAIDVTTIPRPDPVYVAFNFINANSVGHGGLWVSGDRSDALKRLRWIVGDDLELIELDDSGAIHINRQRLAELAGINETAPAEAPLRIAEYITANDGLLLLVQLTQGAHRYLLHIGSRVETLGGMVDVVGGINLDNNYDSRINPYRHDGRKLKIERPPQGFDSIIALNPEAHWFNLRTREFVPAGSITFHELAEAHAKLALSLDYLEQDGRPGAHNTALEREVRLKSQRPLVNVVLTVGSNRLLRSDEELRQFTAQAANEAGHRR